MTSSSRPPRRTICCWPRPTSPAVTGILDAGGAQAVGALAYGTETVPKVDKIVGPGNRYVACAKRLVYGEVGIDGIAGPSEILVLCDETAHPAWVAADLLSQAEHDEAAYPLCIAHSLEPRPAHRDRSRAQLAVLPRRDMARVSVVENGVILVVPSRDAMASLADDIGPEHLALHVRNPDELFERIGRPAPRSSAPTPPRPRAITSRAPRTCLPTGGAVRFSSPLGVYDFVTRTSYIRYEAASLRAHAGPIATFARAEGLEAHARATEVRLAAPAKRENRAEDEPTASGTPASRLTR